MEFSFDTYQIRLLRDNDVPGYFNMVDKNRKRLEDFFAGTVSRTKTLNDTRNFVHESLQKLKDKKYMPFVVIDSSSGNMIGYIDIKNIDWTIPKAELGCFIDETYAGKGISTKGLKLVIDYLFKELKFNKLYLRTHHANTGSRKIAEKNGFTLEGTIRMDYKTTKGELVDLMYYGRLATD